MCVLPEGVQEQRGDGEAGCERAALWPLRRLHEQVLAPLKALSTQRVFSLICSLVQILHTHIFASIGYFFLTFILLQINKSKLMFFGPLSISSNFDLDGTADDCSLGP